MGDDHIWAALAIGAASSSGLLVGAIAVGYVGFGALDAVWPPRLQAFGAGAVLAMTAETMIPEAVHNNPRFSGLFAVFGFAVLLFVTAATRQAPHHQRDVRRSTSVSSGLPFSTI